MYNLYKIPRNRRTEGQFTAYIDYYLSISNYMWSYKQAFDVLIKNVSDSTSHVDHLAYPILFLARHCMELGMKANINYFSKYSEKNDYTTAATHDLEKLFIAFKIHVNETIKNLKKKYNIIVDKEDKMSFTKLYNEVSKLKDTFHVLDKNSDAFRYPHDKHLNPSFKQGVRINILDVAELLDKSVMLFMHTADVLGKYTNIADEQESYLKDLMKGQYE